MSQRSRASRVQQHDHCNSCYMRRCRTRVEVSTSCAITPCRLHCGALFHLCKEEDHLLLCPNVRVPCLNVEYGCRVQLPRSSQAAHLQVCPASVVSCSMDWLRWPIDDTHPNSNLSLQENVQKEHQGQDQALDLAVAIVDQADLYSRLLMEPLYPELMEEEEVEEVEKEEEKEKIAQGGSGDDVTNNVADEDYDEQVVQQVVRGEGFVLNKERFNLMEMMFSMDKGGCDAAQQNLNKQEQQPQHNQRPAEKAKGDEIPPGGPGQDAETPPEHDTSKEGHAPWQEGVMERLKEDLTPQEYNMYMVHHGRMLVSFGHIPACTPREKDFVYGSLEPIPVQTLQSFKVPDSYHYRRRVHLYDVASRAKCESRCLDTSDLGADEEDWFSEEDTSTLLGYAEQQVMGHKISESKAADCLYIDTGMQTHTFRSAPFKRKTTLAEVTVERPPKLLLQLQAESMNSRHCRATCPFSFLCGHTFHRTEFATHFRNVHSDIQMSLSGWFEQRCPLSYLGCTFSQRRFQPSTHKATVHYDQGLRSFNLRPTLEAPVTSSKSRRTERRAKDSLSSLPYEVLCHMASFLDGLSLSQLALVSRLMRQVCSSLLQDRGMVTLRWERSTSTRGGGTKWRAKPVWEFSPLFSAVDSWHMADDVPPISAHLKVCPYYQTSVQNERVPLPSMTEKQSCSRERISLVNQFTAKRREHNL